MKIDLRHGTLRALVIVAAACGVGQTADGTAGPSLTGPALESHGGNAGCAPLQGNISESGLSLFEAETNVASAPDGSIAVVWISNTDSPFNGGFQSIGYRIWRPRCELGPDGWGPVQLITVPGAFYHSDPSVVANERGDFFFSFLAAFGLHTPPDNSPHGWNDRRVYVARLPRGASSVEPAMLATRNPITPLRPDRPTIAVTPRGTLLVSYAEITDLSQRLVRSEDDGATWTESIVDGSGFGFEGQVCVPRRGGRRVYVMKIWWGASGAPGDARARRPEEDGRTPMPGLGDPAVPAIHLHWSDDDGVTFRPEDVNRWPMDPNLGGSFSCDARDDEVWLSGSRLDGDSPDATTSHLEIAHFVDAGLTLASESVPDAPANVFYVSPVIAAGIDEGLDILTYQFGADAPVDGEFIRIHSSDRGQTWSAPDVLAEKLSILGDRHGLGWLGDYVGGAPVRGGGVLAVFPRTRTDLATGTNFPQHVNFFALDAP